MWCMWTRCWRSWWIWDPDLCDVLCSSVSVVVVVVVVVECS